MGGSRAEMRAVDLIEVEAWVVPAGAPAPDGSPRRRPPVRALAATAIIAALAVGATTIVSDRRETERLEGVAGLPGVLQPVPGPVVEQWRSDDRLWPDVARVGGMLVGVTD